MKITVVGSGAWGTALALLLLENGNDVTLWSYHQEESNRMRDTHENPMLKGVPLPEELKLTTDLSSVKGCGLVVLATALLRCSNHRSPVAGAGGPRDHCCISVQGN